MVEVILGFSIPSHINCCVFSEMYSILISYVLDYFIAKIVLKILCSSCWTPVVGEYIQHSEKENGLLNHHGMLL